MSGLNRIASRQNARAASLSAQWRPTHIHLQSGNFAVDTDKETHTSQTSADETLTGDGQPNAFAVCVQC